MLKRGVYIYRPTKAQLTLKIERSDRIIIILLRIGNVKILQVSWYIFQLTLYSKSSNPRCIALVSIAT